MDIVWLVVERMNMVKMRELDLDMRPVDAAAGLEHLGGLVFFDSSGNFPESAGEVISVIAARPLKILTGNIEDSAALEQELAENRAPGEGLPNGGLCGWVEYDGSYCFGVYHEMLVYRHQTTSWYEIGGLSSELRQPSSTEPLNIGDFKAQMERAAYVGKVGAIKEYIAAGDIYQVNLTQKFTASIEGGSGYGLYQQLRETSPAPLSAYLELNGREVLSSSPETFLKFDNGRVETRPIKGTRPRYEDHAEDQRSAFELRTSEKEVAELVMITDLERNDLGKVCEFGSVQVESMLKLEKYEQVYHLVSTVVGQLAGGSSQLQAMKACFPGGSITGAPKKRAMEIIEQLECEPRGLYTGVIGYFGFNGQSQFNIVIRTLVREEGTLHYHVGAGIVADSDPESEYVETLQKASGIKLSVDAYKNRA